MKNLNFLLFVVLLAFDLNAQVGINTNTPASTLDVVGEATVATSLDGIIPPRLTGNQLDDKTYTASQTGAIVYVTTADTEPSGQTVNVNAAGYYYFNGTRWIPFTDNTQFNSIVYTNNADPNNATIFDNVTPVVANDTNLDENFNSLYIGSNQSTWVWNGTNYVSKIISPSTEWFINGTTADAGANKTGNIFRTGGVVIGGSNSQNVGSGSLTVGTSNTNSNLYSIVAGQNNNVTGSRNLVSGSGNSVTARDNMVTGVNNTISNIYNIVNGTSNTSTSSGNLIVGQSNRSTSINNIIGGSSNTVSNSMNVVSGQNNTVSNRHNFVGGELHTVSNQRNIIGGFRHTVSGSDNLVAGNRNSVNRADNLVVGGNNTLNLATTTSGGTRNIIGGSNNGITGDVSWSLLVGRNHTGTSGCHDCAVFGFDNDFLGTVTSTRGLVAGRNHDITNAPEAHVILGYGVTSNGAQRHFAWAADPNRLSVTHNQSFTLDGSNGGTFASNNTYKFRAKFTNGFDFVTGGATAVNALTIASNGNVTIAGTATAGGTLLTSDARLKANVRDLTIGLEDLVKLSPKVYDKKISISSTDIVNRDEFGLIAQEVKEIIPSLVTEIDDEDKTLAVNYTALVPVLIKAMQEQQKHIEQLEEELNVKNDASSKQMDNLKAEIEMLKAIILKNNK